MQRKTHGTVFLFKKDWRIMLQINKERLETISVTELNKLISPLLEYRKSMHNRYTRKSSPFGIMGNGKENDGRAKTIVSFEHYIVNMAEGYLGGKAPVYKVSDETFEKALEHTRKYNDDGATFIELIHDYLTTASAYLYVFQDEFKEIRYVKLDTLQTVMLYDYSTPPKPIASVRKWEEEGIDGKKISIYEKITATERTVIDDTGVRESELHLWGDVPVIAFESKDNIAIFEPVLTIIDTYEQVNNNIKNYTHSNDLAKMLIAGYDSGYTRDSDEHKEVCTQMLKENVIFTDEGGKIEWLLKDVDYSGLLEVLKQQHQNITMLTGVPNMSDENFGNASSGVALGYKLYPLEQYSSNIDRVFKKGYLGLIELIVARLKLLNKANDFDFRDVDIQFIRNIPTDKGVDTNTVISIKNAGLISTETAIGMLPYDVDTQSEIQKINDESEENYNKFIDRGTNNELLDESGQADESVASLSESI